MAEAQGSGAAFQGVSQVGGGYVQAAALRAQADYQQKVMELNNKTLDYQAGVTDQQAADAEKRGGQAVGARAQKERLDVGAKRAAITAAGGDTSSEMAANAVGEVETVSADDQASISTSAWREAFGFKSQGIAIRGQQEVNKFQARVQGNALQNAARSSIITGWNEGIATGLEAAGGGGNSKKKPAGEGDAPKLPSKPGGAK